MKGNVIVGQSGGPTAAINSSLAGVYRTAKDRGAAKVYGMLHGIQGLLQERYIDLSEYITNELDAELLKRTPAAFLGSCRYKLPEIHENREVYEKKYMRRSSRSSTNWISKHLSTSAEMIPWIRSKSSPTMRSSPDIRPVSSAARRPLTMTLPLQTIRRATEALPNTSALL